MQWLEPEDEICPFGLLEHSAVAECSKMVIRTRCHLTSNSMAPRVVNEEEGFMNDEKMCRRLVDKDY